MPNPSKNDTPVVSVGMPAYNEAGQLESSVGKLVSALERLAVPFEIVVVDDGSTDSTASLAESMASRDGRVRLVRHPVNRGVGAGIATAMRSARGEFFILVPADLAMDPDAIGRYLALTPEADIVAGYTGARPDYNFYRTLVSRVNGGLLRALFGLSIRNFNYIHMYRTSLLRQIPIRYTGSAILYAEIFVKAKRLGARFVQVEIPYLARAGGQATGAKASLILRTGRDMARLWVRKMTGNL
jgi:glycosyltransferase involved in cell wall biosynthesis